MPILYFYRRTGRLSKLAESCLLLMLSPHLPILIYIQKTEVEKSWKGDPEIAQNLKNAGLADPLFFTICQTVKWTPSSILYLTEKLPDTLARIQSLLLSLDGGTEGVAECQERAFFISISTAIHKIGQR